VRIDVQFVGPYVKHYTNMIVTSARLLPSHLVGEATYLKTWGAFSIIGEDLP
jgi:hypothetical protein